MTTKQSWCQVQLYSPSVVRVGDLYKMWYVGNSSATRTADMSIGLAESDDGIHWREHPQNPVLRPDDLPWGLAWQTPRVLYDLEEGRYRMWFVMSDLARDADGNLIRQGQKLGYAASPDGLRWDIHPEPIYPSGRGPSILKEGPGAYRMWMNSAPTPEGDFQELVANIYHFESSDGLVWRRDPEPVVTPNDKRLSIVYPFVLRQEEGYVMWYGCHVAGGFFEVYCSTSPDGRTWTHHDEQPAFPASRDHTRFDGRYTSTPCVIDDGDRYLLYFSTRDQGSLYGAGDGTVKADASGIYRHVGVAEYPKDPRQPPANE